MISQETFMRTLYESEDVYVSYEIRLETSIDCVMMNEECGDLNGLYMAYEMAAIPRYDVLAHVLDKYLGNWKRVKAYAMDETVYDEETGDDIISHIFSVVMIFGTKDDVITDIEKCLNDAIEKGEDVAVVYDDSLASPDTLDDDLYKAIEFFNKIKKQQTDWYDRFKDDNDEVEEEGDDI